LAPERLVREMKEFHEAALERYKKWLTVENGKGQLCWVNVLQEHFYYLW
jgi:hypothetical protein